MKIDEINAALSYLRKAHEIQEQESILDDLASSYSYLYTGKMYDRMQNFSKALLYHEKALRSCQKTSTCDNILLANIYKNFAWTYVQLGEFEKARSSVEKSLNTLTNISIPSYSFFGQSFFLLTLACYALEDYSAANMYIQRAQNYKRILKEGDLDLFQAVQRLHEAIQRKL